MKYFSFIWFIINIFLILAILLRDNDDRSLQENLINLLITNNFNEIKKNLDRLIWLLIFFYFFLGISYNTRFVV